MEAHCRVAGKKTEMIMNAVERFIYMPGWVF